MCSKFFLVTGLVLNMIGTWLIYKYGLPQKIDRDGASHLLLEGTDEKEKQKAQKFDRLSGSGLIAIAIGFGLQLIGTLFS